MPTSTAALLRFLDTDHPNALARLQDFLAIPSVSTDPAYQDGIARAARFLVEQLAELGFVATIEPTAGHPAVLAHTRPGDAPSGAPRVLFYGHYDVQPPDPLELWTTPPFAPVVRDGRIFARGASDDKGPVMCFLEALRAWRAVGTTLPVDLTVLIEGEEEIGSANLRPLLKARRDEFAADIAVICDTAMWDARTPALTYGLRGLRHFDLQLRGPNRDVHSGVCGGSIANPAVELTAVLGRLFDAQHRVTIPGFYDDVPGTDAQERKRWAELGFDEAQNLAGIGAQPHGEAGFDALQRGWTRPSCDINGLYGGYGGPGAKTIIPSFAGAKVSFRLAPFQRSDGIAAAFRAWLEAHDVRGCTWKITDLGGCDPVVMPIESPYLAAASRAIEQAAGRKPVFMREGATVPVVSYLKQDLNLDSVLVGFGLHDDCIHAPNERFGLDRFRLGCRTLALLLGELAQA